MDNLGFGLTVTVLGLGIVFGLLVVLWGLLTLALRADRGPDPAADAAGAASEVPLEAAPATTSTEPDGDADGDAALVAAIAVAVARHVEQRRRHAAPAMRSYWPGSLLFASRWVAAGRMRQGRTWTRR